MIVSDIVGEVLCDDYGEFILKGGSKVGSMDGRIFGKDVDGIVHVIIIDSLY